LTDLLAPVAQYLSTGEYWLYFFLALGLATAVGIIPGVGSTLVMAIALPIIVLGIEDPVIGILMLAVITGTSNTFDSIPAQLMGVVNSGTQVTFLEGHQLARKGLGAYSLGAVYAVSAIGGVVGAICLLLAIPFIRPVIVNMSNGEIAMLALFGIMMVAVLSRGAVKKGLVSGLLGLLAATVGLQTYSGVNRYTFDNFDLSFYGLPLVATVMGLMALPEIIDLAITGLPVSPKDADVSNREVFRGFREGLRRWRIAVRHSLIGVGIGAIPGTGGSAVTWISYAVGMARTKDKSEFGKGSLDGLLFAESSENAKEGGQAIPTLGLGIPGSTSWALVIVAMIAYGIAPGPGLLTDHPDVVGLIVVSFGLANLVLTLLALLVTRQIMRVTLIPYAAVAGTVLPIMVVSAYFDTRSLIVFPVLIIFGILGFAMKHYGWPRPPFVLAFVLGPIIEANLHDAISIHGIGATVTRPLTIIIFLISVGITWFLIRTMAQSEEVEAELTEVGTKMLAEVEEESAAGSHLDASSVLTEPNRKPNGTKFYWRSEHILPICLLILGFLGLIQALGYDSLKAQTMPVIACAGIILLSGAQLFIQARQPSLKKVSVMDLDVRSYGIEGTGSSAKIVVGILACYVLAAWLFGLQWSSLVPAVLIPLLLLKERRSKLISTVVCVLLVGAFMYFIGDVLLAILWPEGILFQ
jgi:putative tricarboxylic transport membrane protein